MLKTHVILSILVSTSIHIPNTNAQSAVIAAWDFNSSPPDLSTYSGTLAPSAGHGTARTVGGTQSFFHTGSTNDPSSDNSSWSLFNFPAQDTANKTAGAEFRINTSGYENLSLEFEAQPGPNASRLCRLQYSTNGINFFDGGRLDIYATNQFFVFNHEIRPEGMDNNPNFAFRIVTEFERTISGIGNRGYVAQGTNRYSPYGGIRLDQVRLTGDPINPANSPPMISTINDLTWPENQTVGPITFSLGDPESESDELHVIVTSSHHSLVPHDQLQINGSGSDRTLTLTPLPDQIGETTINVTVVDPEGAWISERFVLSVISVNVPPGLSGIPMQHIEMNTSSGPILFGAEDGDTPSEHLHLSATSSNRRLIRSIHFEGTGGGRSMEIIPATDEVGTSVVTVTLFDGRDTDSKRFAVVVTAPPDLAAYDSFDYAEGDLETASASAWAVHSRGTTPVMVSEGKVHLASTRNQDVNRPLTGAPYSGSVSVYSGFTVRFSTLPSLAGSYFAHLNTSSFRGRIFAHRANATPGTFRIGIANGAGTRADWPADLSLDQDYRIVTRFNPAEGMTTLWIDPSSELDPGIEAVDAPTPTAVTAFALRQASGIGRLTVDEFKFGQSFSKVMKEAPAALAIRVTDGGLIHLSWPLSQTIYQLQRAVSVDPAVWTDVVTPPEQQGQHWTLELPCRIPNIYSAS